MAVHCTCYISGILLKRRYDPILFVGHHSSEIETWVWGLLLYILRSSNVLNVDEVICTHISLSAKYWVLPRVGATAMGVCSNKKHNFDQFD